VTALLAVVRAGMVALVALVALVARAVSVVVVVARLAIPAVALVICLVTVLKVDPRSATIVANRATCRATVHPNRAPSVSATNASNQDICSPLAPTTS